MRACWLDAGENPNGVALDKHGVKETCWDAHSTFTTTERIDAWRSKYAQRIYVAQNWAELAAEPFAAYVSSYVNRFGGDRLTANRQLGVDVNIEIPNEPPAHDPNAYLLAFLPAWRKLRPQRDTRLLLQGLQAGWFSKELVAAINTDVNLRVLAEAFYDAGGVSMLPYDADAVRSNLQNYGIERSRSAVVYDAARLQSYWDGTAFTSGRLA